MHYEVREGKDAEFKAGFQSVVTAMKTLPGHVDSHLFEDSFAPGSYMILSQWKTKEDFQSFIASPGFAKATAWGKAEILKARPVHKVYTNE
jgi:heme-degrading monooxygenase HmoA